MLGGGVRGRWFTGEGAPREWAQPSRGKERVRTYEQMLFLGAGGGGVYENRCLQLKISCEN